MFKKPANRKPGNLSQFGLLDMDVDGIKDDVDCSDDSDIDIEAELAAISGGSKPHRPRKPAPVPSGDLNAMIAASLRDVPTDDEGSGDDDDPELLSELRALSVDEDDEVPPSAPARSSRPAPPPPIASADSGTVSLLQDRISNYTIAERNAKEKGDSSRARRFGRGLKTLNDLLKQAKAGKPVNDEDIPPPVSLGKPPEPVPESQPPQPPPRSTSIPSAPDLSPADDRPATPPEPDHPPPPPPDAQPTDPVREQGLQIILKRKEEFKAAALECKRAGEKDLALEYVKVMKQFDIVLEAYKSGQEMDLNELPTPSDIAASFKAQAGQETSVAEEPSPAPAPAGLVTATTVEEALAQRLAHFQEQEAKAKEEGNASKARRMGRIVKQYQDAIKLNARGKPIPIDELPTPNGFAPIPGDTSAAPPPAPPGGPPPAPRPPTAPSAPSAPSTPASARPGPAGGSKSRYDKQLAILLHRQKEFREAAVKAKKSGNIEQAKEFLRASKGFDSVIEAARGGLAVDMKSLPVPPSAQKQLEDTFDLVSAEECFPPSETGEVEGSDLLSRLQQQLLTQLKVCATCRDHYRDMGNVAESNRFENLALTTKQDLDVVELAQRLGQPPPKFHYENRQFAIVQCNTDLPESVLELTIVRGIAYNVPNPNEVDTYVKFEFAFPQEAPIFDRTALVKDTSSPQYDAVFSLPIQRNSRACQRFFKRHAIKFEVYSRGGWFSKDALVGTAAVKLAPLETQVTLHDSFPLMDGRRAAGGSLEVKLRLRTPLLQQQILNSTHRWLVVHAA